VSLDNLGTRHSALGQHATALACAEEALETLWPFFTALPAAFENDAGRCLNNLRGRLAALGRSTSPALLARIALFNSKRHT
jgi:hypothetical protein